LKLIFDMFEHSLRASKM